MALTAGRLYLKYAFPTLPALVDRNGEAIVNWTNHGTHTIAASATHAHGGTKSFLITTSLDAGDFTTNYVSIPSASNATFVVGAQYAISLWGWSGANNGNGIQIKTGGVVMTAQGFGNTAWEPANFIFTASSASTDLQVCLNSADECYIDDIVVSKCVYFDVMMEKGLTDPDDYEYFPSLQKPVLDGTIIEQWTSFRRNPSFDVGVVAAHSDRVGILDWTVDTARQIDYGTEAQLPMALKNSQGLQWQWLNNVEIGRQVTLEMKEPSVRTSFPV